MSNREEYDWIDDPFDDEKNARLMEQYRGGCSPAIVVLALLAVVAVIALCVFAFAGLGSLASAGNSL